MDGEGVVGRVAFKQCDVERLLRAAKRVGYRSPTVDKLPDGTLRLLTDEQPRELSPLEQWESAQGDDRAP
jgi:hypothetical protein